MNEEIGRILRMLENGTVTAEEAERLIRAAGEAGTGGARSPEAAGTPPHAAPTGAATAEDEARIHTTRAIEDFWDPFSPFANPLPDLGDCSRAFRRIKARIRRHNTRRFWLSYFRLNRWYETRRNQRRATMSVYERVRFVLLGAPPSAEFILQAQTDIYELLEKDQIAWDLFKLGLEEEFGFETTMEQVRSFRTVQDVVDYVEQRQPPSENKPATEPASELEPDEPWDRPRPDELAEPQAAASPAGRKRGGQGTSTAPAGSEPGEQYPEAGGTESSGLPPVE